jgi:hypothetical protein
MYKVTKEEKARKEGRRHGNFNRKSTGSKNPPEDRGIEEGMRRA